MPTTKILIVNLVNPIYLLQFNQEFECKSNPLSLGEIGFINSCRFPLQIAKKFNLLYNCTKRRGYGNII